MNQSATPTNRVLLFILILGTLAICGCESGPPPCTPITTPLPTNSVSGVIPN